MAKLNWGMRACGILLLWATAAIALPAQTTGDAPAAPILTTVHSFDYTDGYGPIFGLVQGTDGKLYGTTFGGGCGEQGEGEGCGTVFKITPNGKLTSLYTFCSQGGNECTDGLFPEAGLVQGTDGIFYGTTSNGGAGYGHDNGTVFKITASGKLTTLYSFCSQSNCTDGTVPFGGVVQGTDGSFYGTTGSGGAGYNNDGGTVFSITARGKLTSLYSFCSQGGQDCTDGLGPEAGLVQGTDGNFYGTTIGGGAYRLGTVFSISAGGALTTLYSFCAQGGICADGDEPQAALVQGTDGNFYGTTSYGGNAGGGGTVFKITPGGTLTTLYNFCSKGGRACTDGGSPEAGLVQGTDGNFYGTTEYGGINGVNCSPGCGTIFEITPGGELTTLYDFCSQTKCADGVEPLAGLFQDTNGTFYGTAGGGANSDGIVFSLSVGIGPFVKTLPAFGKMGTPVHILGTNLTGTNSVTFNGTPATFTVVSKTIIFTNVPAGATTGTVQVITPGGTLKSNVPFRVTP